MEWYGDTLIIVPQFPWFSDKESSWDGDLYAISKESLVKYLSGKNVGKLTPQAIPLSAPGLLMAVEGFDGFEGIAFHGDQVYMTIEASDNRGATGYVVSGEIAPDLSVVTLDMKTIQNLPAQANRSNKSDEVIFVAGEEVVTMYEVNGVNINTNPFARYFNLKLEGPFPRPLPHVEYRLTDATAPDEQGRFWVINIYWDGEPVYYSDADPIAQKYGEGPSHRRQENVERLLEMQYSPKGITLTERPPVQIKLSSLRIRATGKPSPAWMMNPAACTVSFSPPTNSRHRLCLSCGSGVIPIFCHCKGASVTVAIPLICALGRLYSDRIMLFFATWRLCVRIKQSNLPKDNLASKNLLQLAEGFSL